MGWEFFVSIRYLTAKRRERFISLISFISILGVTIGVAALIVVISVMSGFDEELKERIIGINSHIVIEPAQGIYNPGTVVSRIKGIEHVVSGSSYVHGQAMLRVSDTVTGVILRGIEPKEEVGVTKISSYLVKGSLDFGKDGIVLGSELAVRLGLGVGDKVSVISPVYEKGQELTVVGIFASGMYDYDANLAYADIAKAQDLFGVKDLASGISVKVDDAFNVNSVKDAIAEALPGYTVRTWMDSNRNLLAALKLEKTVMFLILALIVLVACFNIASTLIMTVLEKTKDIGILKAIGATKFGIMKVFAVQGGIIGSAGTILGAGFGIALCWLLKTFKFIQLPKDIYYIDRLPVRMEWNEISVIVASSLAISLLATLYPSLKASRLDPVEALRYE